jgi:hypothetical protein
MPGLPTIQGRKVNWICEFCFKMLTCDRLPDSWDRALQSSICPECQPRVERDGGYAVVPGGAYAEGPDPRGCMPGCASRWAATSTSTRKEGMRRRNGQARSRSSPEAERDTAPGRNPEAVPLSYQEPTTELRTSIHACAIHCPKVF